jgi:hypothetical protein
MLRQFSLGKTEAKGKNTDKMDVMSQNTQEAEVVVCVMEHQQGGKYY